jgi:phosphinothricin acetyltransferase
MVTIAIRPADRVDLPRLVEIYNHYVVHTPVTFDVRPFTVEQRVPWFDQFQRTGRHRLFVAEESGVVIGYVGTHSFRTKPAYESTAETTIYCAPEATGRRVGSALYTELFAALRAEDIHVYMAGITLPNDASVAMHERFGFKLCGTMHAVGRKFDAYWDVAWYERL